MKYLPKVPDDAYVKVETTKILKQHKAYMACLLYTSDAADE